MSYTLVNTVVADQPASFYVSVGYAVKNDPVETTMRSVSVGADFSFAKIIAGHRSWGFSLTEALLGLDNVYINTEIGYGSINQPKGKYYNGLVGRLGMKLMF